MSTLQEKNAVLLSELGETLRPSSRSISMIGYLRDARKDQQITLYEYYLVETERVSFEHQACVQPGWPCWSRNRRRLRCGTPGGWKRTG